MIVWYTSFVISVEALARLLAKLTLLNHLVKQFDGLEKGLVGMIFMPAWKIKNEMKAMSRTNLRTLGLKT